MLFYVRSKWLMRVLVYVTILTFLPSSAGAGNLFPPAKPEPV